MRLVTVAQAAELAGKSERSVWRYVQKLEAEGRSVVYRMPGVARTFVDYDLVGAVALTRQMGNPRTRRAPIGQ